MTRSKKRILIVAATTLLFLPVAARADIVFDPTNFVEAVLEVADDVEMVDQLYQEVTNGVAMVKSWNFTQLPGLSAEHECLAAGVLRQAGPTRPPIPATR